MDGLFLFRIVFMSRIILITGATAGIGEACAFKLAEQGNSLILTGRRSDRLEKLAAELSQKFKIEVKTLCFDVRNFEECDKSLTSLQGKWKSIDVLINNAGLAAGKETIQEAKLEDWDQMIDTNVKGLLYVSKILIPAMIEKGKGHIINIGSIAGKENYSGGSVYCGTKYAVEGISGAMRKDLISTGIKVSTVCPGLVDTEFSIVRFKGDKERANQTYLGMKPLTGKDVADLVNYILEAPEHVNIADVLILPKSQASSTVVHRE